ncbi:MAG: flagellar biosynthesis protein FlhA [Micavibrio sp.]|nr:flagellar biosynthesis protein FlhA [Micavibrio sp.]
MAVNQPSGPVFSFIGLRNTILSGRFYLALGIVAIVVAFIFPMPSGLLDLMLVLSLAFAVLILMMALFIEKSLDFSTFPTVLLIATMLRLALNLASTRLILSNGHEGQAAAGHVIAAFGHFIIQDSYIIGAIVFTILVIVNFVVITKGSGRIAEVAARFSLDAMPGKQMAIDSDLSSGLINEAEAKAKRLELEQESTFFGAMDGAAKFVKGDAIAGLMITFINILGGIVYGTLQQGITLSEAAQTYTILTIGDGLVSQIPALIISVAAGILVSKAGINATTQDALFKQFQKYPAAFAMSGVMMLILGILPGIPFVPFAVLGLGSCGLAYMSWRGTETEKIAVEQKLQLEHKSVEKEEKPIGETLALDNIRIELGYGLLQMVNGQSDRKITDQIKGVRQQLAEDVGFVLPAVRVMDNLQLPANAYTVKVKEITAGSGEIRPNMLLCMDPTGKKIDLPGEVTTEPTFGLPAMWVDEKHKEEAHFKGYTVVDASTVITTHLTEIIKDSMVDLLSYAETRKLLDELGPEHKKLIEDVVPTQITVTGLQRILQTLLAERISIRDLPAILEGIAEASAYTKSSNMITEHVRMRMARQLCNQFADGNGVLKLCTLSPEWEQNFLESLIGDGEEKQLAMAPSKLQDFISAVRKAYEEYAKQGESPVLLTSATIRPYVRSIIERFRSAIVVMSQNEVHPKAKIKTMGSV